MQKWGFIKVSYDVHRCIFNFQANKNGHGMVDAEAFANETAFFPTSRPPPKRMLPHPSLPISKPIKSAKYNAAGGIIPANAAASTAATGTDSDSSSEAEATSGVDGKISQVHSKYDLLVWFEVLELGN